MNEKKKFISLLIITVMLLAFMPQTALAASHNMSDGQTLNLSTGKLTQTSDGTLVTTYTVNAGDTVTVAAGATAAITGSKNVQISCGAGVTLTLDSVTSNVSETNHACALGFTGSGNSLILTGTNTLSSGWGEPGVRVEEGTSLTISGSGSLDATGGSSLGSGIGAGGGVSLGTITINSGTITAKGITGIGSSHISGGTININGGNITASSSATGAGIGGGYQSYVVAINISGGTINATGGSNAAGIGGGQEATSGNITISGGTVTATGGYKAAGIGTGPLQPLYHRNYIKITGGIVRAIGGKYASGIGCGPSGEVEGSISISGGYVYAEHGDDTNMTSTVYDIGDGPAAHTYEINDMTVSGTAAVFLANNSSQLTSSSHTHYAISSASGGYVYGVEYPADWSAPFGAFLRTSTITYDTNGGSGTAPDAVTQQIGTTTTISDGSGITGTVYEWNTDVNGIGTVYAPGALYTFGNDDLLLYAILSEAPTGISLSGTAETILDNESVTLIATVTPDGANSYVTWTSSDTDVATVDEDGVVSGVAPGCAMITATTTKGQTATCKVTVDPSSDGTYDIGKYGSDSVITLQSGLAVTLTNTGDTTFTNMQIDCGAGVALTLDGVKIDDGDNIDTCALSFTGIGNTLQVIGDSTLTSGSNEPGIRVEDSTALEIDGSAYLYATGGSGSAGIGSGAGSSAGTINLTGGIIAAAYGAGATYDINGTVTISGAASVMLRNDATTATTASHTHYDITDTSEGSLYGVVYPSGWATPFGAYLRLFTLTYDTNDGTGEAPESVAQSGSTAITVADGSGITHNQYDNGGWNTADDGSGSTYASGDTLTIKSDTTLYVKWEYAAVSSVTFTNTEETMLDNETLQLTATVSPENATYPELTWVSSKTSVATVDQNGLVTPVRPGCTTITATAEGKSATCKVTVNPSQDGTYNISYYGDGSIITMQSGLDVALTNTSGATWHDMQIVCGEGVALELNNVKISNYGYTHSCPVAFTGSSNTLTWAGSSYIKGGIYEPGIRVEHGTELEINGTGSADVIGGDNSAGIGGGDGSSGGTITINSGTTKTTGGYRAAGIGGGRNGDGGTITINGGSVTARGAQHGASIGGGENGDGGTIKITGGTVTSGIKTYSSEEAGIGGGYYGNGGNIEISGGNVTVWGGGYAPGIGGGRNGDGGTIKITGGTVSVTSGSYGDYDIGPGKNGSGGSLKISGTAAVFLKNDTCITPVTSHTHYEITDISDGSLYGVSYPSGWTATFGAYLYPCTLSYSANGGINTVPDAVTLHAGLTTTISDGSGITKDTYTNGGWNTADDGSGKAYGTGDTFTFEEDTTLYIDWNEIRVTDLSLSSNTHTLERGDILTLMAMVSPDDATYPEVTWTSSDTDIATVDSTGKVTAVDSGTATITATADGKSAACEITVEVSVTGVTLSSHAEDMDRGDTLTLTATVSPDDTTKPEVAWTSSDTLVATVSSGGFVTAIGEGTAIITAAADGKSDTCTVTVENRVTSVTLSSSSENMDRGDTLTLTATVSPDDSTYPEVTWSSSDASVATVDSNGQVTAVNEGTATITATADRISDTCAITVENRVKSVTISSRSENMDRGDTLTLTAAVSPSDATHKAVTWTSSDTSVATVDGTGKVTAISGGSATITATADGKMATCVVTVKAVNSGDDDDADDDERYDTDNNTYGNGNTDSNRQR